MPENLPLDNENTETVEDAPQPEEVIVVQKPHPIKRFGCGVLLILWFTLLMTPCGLFYLAGNGEIRIWHSDIPEPDVHPRLLLELVSEVDYRGLQLTRSYSVDSSADNTCVQTDVSFYLWQSIEEDLDSSYCDCYERENDEASWLLNATTVGACSTVSD